MVKKMKTHFHKKRSLLHVKSFVYSLVAMFFLFSFYGTYFFTDRYTEYEGLIMWPENAVQADYIAKVVEFDGSFYIEHKGKRVQTSNIQDGDVVTLKENAQLVFHINEATKAKLIWPAQFSIETIEEWESPSYKLNIIKGDFIEVKSLEEKPNQKIQVNLEDVMMVQEANGKPIDYQLVKADEGHIVKNNGWQLLVTTMDKDHKEQKTNVNKQQVLAIQENDITLYDDVDKFAIAMREKNISQTFTLNTPQEAILIDPTITTETGSEQGDITTAWITELTLDAILLAEDVEVDQGVSSQLSSLLWDTEKVISPSQNEVIRSTLDKNLLLSDINKLYVGIQQWDSKSLDSAYSNLEKKISNLYSQFDMKYISPSLASVKDKLISLKGAVQEFNSSVSSQYSMPPKYSDNLNILSNRLNYLAGQSLWLDEENAVKNREKLINNLPNNLKFY